MKLDHTKVICRQFENITSATNIDIDFHSETISIDLVLDNKEEFTFTLKLSREDYQRLIDTYFDH